MKHRLAEIRTLEVGEFEIQLPQHGFAKREPRHAGAAQPAFLKGDIERPGLGQIGAGELAGAERRACQNRATK